MEGGITKGKGEISGDWIIRDKHGKIKEQGTDSPTQGGKGEEDV